MATFAMLIDNFDPLDAHRLKLGHKIVGRVIALAVEIGTPVNAHTVIILRARVGR